MDPHFSIDLLNESVEPNESTERDGLSLVLSDGSQVGVSRGRKSQVGALLSPRLR